MKTANTVLSLMVIVLSLNIGYAQVSINTDGTDPDASAMLDVKSTTSGLFFRIYNLKVNIRGFCLSAGKYNPIV